MTQVIYEYMAVVRSIETNWGEIASFPPSERPEVEYEISWELWWPNATEAEWRSDDTTMTALFTELGRDGWKLVTSNVLDSTIAPTGYGWPEAGIPVRERWIFLREVPT